MIVFVWGHKLPEGSLYSLNHRKSDTQVQKGFGHKRVQGMKDHDDLLPLFLFYDVQHTPLIHEVRLQCDDAFEDWLLDLEGFLCPSQYVFRCFPLLLL